MKKILLTLSIAFISNLAFAQLYISEILVSPPGDDSPNEYIELRGTPNTVIAADTYLIQVEGDGEADPGDVETNSDSSNGCTVNGDGITPCPQGGIIDLSGIMLGSNGYLVIASTGNPYSIDPESAVLLDVTDGNLEDQSHTFFIVNTNGNGAPTTSDDIDANDDGEIDAAYAALWTFIDGISFVDDDNINNVDPTDNNDEFAYADVIFAENTFDPANSPTNSLNAPASSTIIYTSVQYDYAARVFNSTGQVINNDIATSDWIGGELATTDLSIENWEISRTVGRAFPENVAGYKLNHIGGPGFYRTNNMIITEIMTNPEVTQNLGEYFEVYNADDHPINMEGWTITEGDGNGADEVTIPLIVQPDDFAVFARNADKTLNGGVVVDFAFNFSLSDAEDEIVLNAGVINEVDRVEYTDNAPWPDANDAAMVFTGGVTDDNNDGLLWIETTTSENIKEGFGSPGILGSGQVLDFLVYNGGAWNVDPDNTTSSENAVIQNGEYTLTADVALNNVNVNPGAALNVPSGFTLTTASVNLKSCSDTYSSLIQDGTILGTISYSRFVNIEGTGATGTGGNDLISLPLIPSGGITFDAFVALGNPANSTKIPENGTEYGFGPYDNALTQDYSNFAISSTDPLVNAKGYRTATNNGENLTFSGNVETGNVGIDIITPGGGSQWNLIGNPYPSYISSQDFLNANSGVLDPTATAIYGYNAGTSSGGGTTGNFTIINAVSNNSLNIAPGQGFFVAARNTSNFSGTVNFTNGSAASTDMRTTTGSDDFIQGRSNSNYNLRLALTGSDTHITNFYFNANSTLGLDPGYDAATFGGFENSFHLYSHLIEDNEGRSMAIQSLNDDSLMNVNIPLGVIANQGEQISFSIDFSSLPNDVNVYLEDNVANIFTLLNTSDYTLTPNVDLNGTGRFFLRFSNSVLSTPENDLNDLNIFTDQPHKTIVVNGQLLAPTVANIYDMQGRLVTSKALKINTTSQNIDVNHLSTGIYVVTLNNADQKKTQKIILR